MAINSASSRVSNRTLPGRSNGFFRSKDNYLMLFGGCFRTERFKVLLGLSYYVFTVFTPNDYGIRIGTSLSMSKRQAPFDGLVVVRSVI